MLVGIAQREGRMVGVMQLYSVDKGITQSIEGHAAAFAKYQADANSPVTTLFCFASRTPAASKLYVIEVGDPTGFQRKAVDIFFPPEAQADFPVAMQVSEKYEVVYMITKFGYVYMFHLPTGQAIMSCRISSETIFVTAPHLSTNGVIGVNRKGQVLSVSVDPSKLIPYVSSVLNNIDLARDLAVKGGLPGAEDLFNQTFNQKFAMGDWKGAATIAADSPGGVLRTPATMQKFAMAPALPGAPPPLLQYFGVLLEKGKLNKFETIELGRMFVQQGRHQVLEKWLGENKLECSDELGELIRPVDLKLALQVFLRADSKSKVVDLLAQTGQFDKIIAYAKRANFTPDYSTLLAKILPFSPPGALQLAQLLLNDESGPLVNANLVADMFMQKNLVKETTSLLLDVLKFESGNPKNTPEDGPLQTKLLEINLRSGAAQVAEHLLATGRFTQFDKNLIADLCEKSGLQHRALELYTDISAIRRVMASMNPAMTTPEFLINFFSKLTPEDALQCLRDLMRSNPRANLQNVVQISIKYSEQFTAKALIQLFETNQSWEGLFLFLGHLHKYSQDPEIHFKYIEAAVKMGQLKEVERVCRESSFYEPEKVRDFLKEAKLPDQLPLIIVCDRFDFVTDLTTYLLKNNLNKYIEAYVQKFNPAQTPTVVGTLLDLDAPEDYVRNLILSVRGQMPVDELVAQLEKRGRLKVIQPWLEQRAAEGSKEPALHNALAKIAIDLNREPEKFLLSNPYYDSVVVGKYCENRDPYLSFVAYKRGMCSAELIDVTNRHGLFKNQARYLVERQDEKLWDSVLREETPFRRSLIDQVVQVALPESNNPDEVSATVKAFMQANLPRELIELLEKIVLESGTKFAGNRDLSNLLILTAIKAEQGKVVEYINRLENYDGVDIANIAIGAGLFEEAFTIFKKFKYNVQAIQVLIEQMKDLAKAAEFAERCNEPEVWTKLAKAQIDGGRVKEAIDGFIKAQDATYFPDVIAAAEKAILYDDLVRYLQVCRKKVREPAIESELVFALAKTNKLAELEEFITGPNCAQIQIAADRVYDQGLFEAARLLYSNVSNFGRLAQTLVKLGQFSAAVDAAKKANNIRSWKEVCLACIDAKEFRLAQSSALNIIIHGDELDELVRNYESRGYTEEVIKVLESGLVMERAHVGMFTELSILYSKYRPEKLMEHLSHNHSRINIPRVQRTCERNGQWKELCFLHCHYDEWDQAALVMIAHPTEAWEHKEFKDIMQKVNNSDIYYKAIAYYLEEQPLQAKDLLLSIAAKVDHTRVVQLVKKLNHLPLIKEYLVSVQPADVAAVNDALHSLFIEENDPAALRTSVDTFQNYDSIALAQQLEKHELLEFRRIGSHIYKKAGRYAQSLELSKRDEIWKDAMETAADSKDPAVAENLLRFFVTSERPDCFAACLYTCYDLIKPDLAMELAWKNKMMDFCMPYMIQVLREYTHKVDTLTAAAKKSSEAAKEVAAAPEVFVPAPGFVGAPGMPVMVPGAVPGSFSPVVGAPVFGAPVVPGGFGMPGAPPAGFQF